MKIFIHSILFHKKGTKEAFLAMPPWFPCIYFLLIYELSYFQ
jgi:hypothetical protein